jgi:hypothetical protein
MHREAIVRIGARLVCVALASPVFQRTKNNVIFFVARGKAKESA